MVRDAASAAAKRPASKFGFVTIRLIVSPCWVFAPQSLPRNLLYLLLIVVLRSYGFVIIRFLSVYFNIVSKRTIYETLAMSGDGLLPLRFSR